MNNMITLRTGGFEPIESDYRPERDPDQRGQVEYRQFTITIEEYDHGHQRTIHVVAINGWDVKDSTKTIYYLDFFPPKPLRGWWIFPTMDDIRREAITKVADKIDDHYDKIADRTIENTAVDVLKERDCR